MKSDSSLRPRSSSGSSSSEPLRPRYVDDQQALVVREPAAVYQAEAEPAPSWPAQHELEHVSYSIRIPEPPGPVTCGHCRAHFIAAGPTGYAEDRLICDMCLLEGAPELGMVIALVAVVRAFGTVQPSNHEDYRDALAEIGAFARIYERFAAKSGPPRVFRVPTFDPEP
ncbi:MAG: hypothetical protein GY719_33905 [bacterium]|nr:hypothetical protein [bacterium]